MIDDTKQIEQNFKDLNGLRTTNRQRVITELSLNLYHHFKRLGYQTIERNFLKSFIPNDVNRNTQNTILKQVITELTKRNKLKPIDKIKKSIRLYKIKQLYSNDYESYKTLMAKNGFKSYAYIFVFDKQNKIPTNKKIGVFDINQIPNNLNFDLIENKSNKNKKFIGCYTNGLKSVTHSKTKYKIKAFELN